LNPTIRGPFFILDRLLSIANKRGKVFAGFNRNVEAAEAGVQQPMQRKKPRAFGLATEANDNLRVSGRTLGQRATKVRRNNDGEMLREMGPSDPYATVNMQANRQSTLNLSRPGGVA
jgi:hypothetical protein